MPVFFRNLSVTKQKQVKAEPSQLSDFVYDQRLKIHHNTSKAKGFKSYDQGLTPIQCQTLICISKDACIFFVLFPYHIKHKSYDKRVSSVTWIMIIGLKYLTAQVQLKVFKPLIKV